MYTQSLVVLPLPLKFLSLAGLPPPPPKKERAQCSISKEVKVVKSHNVYI